MARTVSLGPDKLILTLPGYDPRRDAEGYEFDAKRAQMACDFFPECLHHIEGELYGQPFALELWQKAIVANLFGWYKAGTDIRRYRKLFLYVPRKSGKTPLAAGIGLYVSFCDDEYGQQNVCAAADREQAALLFRHAVGMIHQEPELEKRCKIYGETGTNQTRTILIPDTGSFLKVISADATTKHGGNLHLVLIDELHAQPNRELVDVLHTSTASKNRKHPLEIYITTADYARESICNEEYNRACKVRDGIISDPELLPAIWEAGKDDDWRVEDTWRKANPNLGVSVSLDYMKAECKRAQDTPTYENTFKRLHLNIITEQDVRWLPLDKWDACVGDVDAEALAGETCYGGLDLSSTTDVTAFSLFFPKGNKTVNFFWLPSVNAHKREQRDRVPYLTWQKQGYIKLTPGDVVDYDIVRSDIIALSKKYKIKEVGADRWNATQIITQLEGAGIKMVKFGQGYASMSSPAKELEKLVIGGQLQHGGNPVLRWMASNVSVSMDAAGNIKPAKDKSTERIDGIVALIMAIGCAGVGTGNSVYNERGPVVV
jgi:phage terminase large subunit-like protein